MTQNPPEQPGGQQPYGASQPAYDPAQGGPGGQHAYGSGGTGPAEPASPMGSPPGGGRQRGNGPIIAGIIIGGLVVLALLLWGAITLIDGRDDTIPTPTPTATDPSDPASEDSSEQPGDQPEPEGGELYDLLTTEAAQVDTDGSTWTVQGSWADASELSAEASEAYTTTYTSDDGELTFTAVSFPDVDAADSYVAGVEEERGDPDTTGPVWQEDYGQGRGSRISYASDEGYSIYWYDDTAVVYQVDAADQATASDFYGSLSF